MTKENINLIQVDDWILRIRTPQGPGPFPVILMLHGLSGDENSMWVFTSRFPEEALLIAPRGIYRLPEGGFSWQPAVGKSWPQMYDFSLILEKLLKLLHPVNFPKGDFSHINLVGFSQGAALALAYLVLAPEKINKTASLSGFLPQAIANSVVPRKLDHKMVFIAHGTKDNQVPIDEARRAAVILESSGAEVIFCEDDVGHKLSASCFRGLEAFFSTNI